MTRNQWLLSVLSAIGVAVIAIGSYVAFTSWQQPAAVPVTDQGPAATSTPVEIQPVSSGTSQKNTAVVSAGLTYEAALDQYRDRRIQLQDCVADPSTQTYKSGTKVMFDNRSPEPTQITLDGRAIRFDGYEFRIVTLSSVTLPKSVSVDCQWLGQDDYNIATLYLQQ